MQEESIEMGTVMESGNTDKDKKINTKPVDSMKSKKYIIIATSDSQK